jgi:hypothetical protein
MTDPQQEPEYLDAPIEQVMVQSALTSTATFQFPEGNVVALEMRAFTIDGKEHHLIWPIPAALPLLQAIMYVCMVALGSPDEMDSWETPNTPDDIDWTGDPR